MPAAIFNGSAVKLLKNTLRFKDNTDFTSVNLLTTTNSKILTNKTLTAPLLTAGTTFDLTAAGTLTIAANAGANNITIGGVSSTLVIPGNLQINGTATYVNTTSLEVVDPNITLNKDGNVASADAGDSGFTVEMSDATNCLMGFDSTLTSKFMCGEVGSLAELVTVSHTQTLTNKTFDADETGNVLSNVEDANIKAAAAIAVNKLAALTVSRALVSDGSGFLSAATTTATELDYVNGVTSSIQTQLDERVIFDITTSSGTFTAIANETHLVDVSAATSAVALPAVAANRFVRIKDKLGSANTHNITVTPASGTIDGAATNVINSDFASVVYVSDGTNWFVL